MCVFLVSPVVDEIAGNHEQIGLRRQTVERLDATCERRRRIDDAVREFARPFNMRVGNLRNDQRLAHQTGSAGKTRNARKSMPRPMISPAFTSTVFGASIVIV